MQMWFLKATNSSLEWHLSENIWKTEVLPRKLCGTEFANYLAKHCENSVPYTRCPI